MNNRIITIFGATGFIGKYVCEELVKAGYTIRVVSRSLERAKLLRTGAFVGQIVPVAGDINRPEDFPKLLEGSYGVVNLVGLLYESGKQKFKKTHEENAAKLAKAAKAWGAAKYVHISAIVDENSKAKYAQTKIAGEQAVLAAFPEAIILKPSVVFGAEDNFFNKFARMAVFSPFLPLIGGGRTKFQPVYVGDVAKAVLSSIDNPNVKGGTYQLAGPQTFTFKELLQLIGTYTNRSPMFLNLPFPIAKTMAIFTPSFILTADQVELLKSDNIASGRSKGLKELGIQASGVDAVVPEYLRRYRKKSLDDAARASH